MNDMSTQTTQTAQKELTSVRDLVWTARHQKVVDLTFLVSGIGGIIGIICGTLGIISGIIALRKKENELI